VSGKKLARGATGPRDENDDGIMCEVEYDYLMTYFFYLIFLRCIFEKRGYGTKRGDKEMGYGGEEEMGDEELLQLALAESLSWPAEAGSSSASASHAAASHAAVPPRDARDEEFQFEIVNFAADEVNSPSESPSDSPSVEEAGSGYEMVRGVDSPSQCTEWRSIHSVDSGPSGYGMLYDLFGVGKVDAVEKRSKPEHYDAGIEYGEMRIPFEEHLVRHRYNPQKTDADADLEAQREDDIDLEAQCPADEETVCMHEPIGPFVESGGAVDSSPYTVRGAAPHEEAKLQVVLIGGSDFTQADKSYMAQHLVGGTGDNVLESQELGPLLPNYVKDFAMYQEKHSVAVDPPPIVSGKLAWSMVTRLPAIVLYLKSSIQYLFSYPRASKIAFVFDWHLLQKDIFTLTQTEILFPANDVRNLPIWWKQRPVLEGKAVPQTLSRTLSAPHTRQCYTQQHLLIMMLVLTEVPEIEKNYTVLVTNVPRTIEGSKAKALIRRWLLDYLPVGMQCTTDDIRPVPDGHRNLSPKRFRKVLNVGEWPYV